MISASMSRASSVSLFRCWILCVVCLPNGFSQQDTAETISRRVFEELVTEITALKEHITELQKTNEELMMTKKPMEALSEEKHTRHSAAIDPDTTELLSCQSQYKNTDRPTTSDHPTVPSEVILYYLGNNDKSLRLDDDSTNKPLHGPKTIHNRYNGETIRAIPTTEVDNTNTGSVISGIGNGISGTDSAAMITMELLAQHHPSRFNNNSLFLYQASHVLDG